MLVQYKCAHYLESPTWCMFNCMWCTWQAETTSHPSLYTKSLTDTFLEFYHKCTFWCVFNHPNIKFCIVIDLSEINFNGVCIRQCSTIMITEVESWLNDMLHFFNKFIHSHAQNLILAFIIGTRLCPVSTTGVTMHSGVFWRSCNLKSNVNIVCRY